ncbi:hypothetical protein WA016_07204 [Myxococcus stipitatus]
MPSARVWRRGSACLVALVSSAIPPVPRFERAPAAPVLESPPLDVASVIRMGSRV